MLLDLTFTVDLEPIEVEALKLVCSGKSDREVALRMGIALDRVKKNFEDLTLHLNLIEATRNQQITWRIHEEKATAIPPCKPPEAQRVQP